MKILIVRFSSLGDIVLTTPVIRCLKKQLRAEIHFLTKKRFEECLLGNSYVDKLFTFSNSIDEIYPALKENRYEIIIDLHNNLRSTRLKFKLKRPSYTIHKGTLQKYLYLYFNINRLNKKHIIDRYFKALSRSQINNDDEGLDFHILPKNEVPLPQNEKNKIAIVLGGTYITKRIPIRLAKEIMSLSEHEFYLIGGSDVETSELEMINSSGHDYVGKLSIQQSASVLSQCDLVITGDTGLMHVAAALKKDLIVIWGSTTEEFGFYPYFGKKDQAIYRPITVDNLKCRPCSKYGKRQCPKGHMHCLRLISANHVILTMNEMLNLN